MVKVVLQTPKKLQQDTGAAPANATVDEKVIHALRQVYDPELPVNVYDLGLIYELKVEGEIAHITMTLTAPNCPVADKIPQDVAAAARSVKGITYADVKLVWDPKWTRDKMSDAARLELGFF